MDASEPEKGDEQEQGHDVNIHIHSPDNRIAGRDFIEVNIHLGERRGRKRESDAASALGNPVEIRQLLESTALEMLFAASGNQRPSNPPTGK